MRVGASARRGQVPHSYIKLPNAGMWDLTPHPLQECGT
jgi:hypothetical protein